MNLFSKFLALIIFGVTFNASAQKDESFQGSITYSISVEGEIDAMAKAQMPTEMVQTYKGSKIRTEQKSAMGNTIIITDNDSKTSTILLDMMGNKMAISQSKEETEKAIQEIPEVKITNSDETKTIAGYTCKKSTIELTGENAATMEVYYTNDIVVSNPNSMSYFKDIKGVMMEYSQSMGDFKMKFIAKEVKKGKIKDNMFTVPADYQQMTQEQFRSLLGQ